MDGWMAAAASTVYAAWQRNLPVNLMSTSEAARKVIPGHSLSYSSLPLQQLTLHQL